MKFDLSSVSVLQNATITSAKLRLYAKSKHLSNYPNGSKDGYTHNNYDKGVYEASKSWDQSTLTWMSYYGQAYEATNSAYGIGNYGSRPMPSSWLATCTNHNLTSWDEWDITSSVQKYLSNSSANYGWIVQMESGSNDPSCEYASSEYSDATLRPELVITYTSGTPATQFSLTTNATNGTVIKSPDAATYDSASTVQLKATPAHGYKFAGWSGSVTSSTNPLSVTMNSNKNITANFTPIDGILMPITSSGNSVSINGDTMFYDDNGPDSSYTQGLNSVLTMEAGDSTHKISIVFDSLYTEQGYDSLIFYDGPSTSSPVISAWTGTTNPGTISSSTKYLTIRFVSDSGGEYYGWIATVKSSPQTPIFAVNSVAKQFASVKGSMLSINAGSDAKVSFIASNGRCLKELSNVSGFSVIDMTRIGLSAGVYLAKISSKEGMSGSIRCIVK